VLDLVKCYLIYSILLLNKNKTTSNSKNLLGDKEAFYNFILKEFIRKQLSNDKGELREMLYLVLE
jgi:hypothetical protein